jgi:hypothetical protein
MRNAYGRLASAWPSLDPVMTGPGQRAYDRYNAPARSSAATYPNVIAGPIVEPAPA